MAESNPDSNKALASVLAIVAVVGGIAAVVRPMYQQVDTLKTEFAEYKRQVERDLKRLDSKMAQDDERERHDAFALGSIQAQIADVKEQVEKLGSRDD